MANNPQLLFVAGPNGAGKSTFSKVLSEPGAIVFDVDNVVAHIEALYPGMPKKRVYEAATEEFFNQVTAAVRNRSHFTLETNFRDDDLADIVAEFKRHGYTANMIFMTLDGVAQSVLRVNQRVKNGGHFVDHKTIRQNYDLGLQYLERYADRFDNLEIVYAGGPGKQLISLLRIQNGKQTYVNEQVPETLNEVIQSIERKFTSAPEKSRKNRRGPRL